MTSKFWNRVQFVFALAATISTVFAYAVPTEVQNLALTDKGDGQVQLKWDAATSTEDVIIGYKIYYGPNAVVTENDFYADEITTSTQTTYTIKGLQPGGTYYFAITAIDSQENESETYSQEASITLGTPQPETPTEPEVTEDSPSTSSEQAAENSTEEETPNEIPDPKTVLDTLSNLITGEETETPAETTEPVIETPTEPANILEPEVLEAAPAIDTAAPVNASDLKIMTDQMKSNGMVQLTWKKSADFDGDVMDQILYTRKGLGDWDNGLSLGKDLEAYAFSVEENQTYQIRLTTIDTNNNESSGEYKTFSTTLAESGPGSIFAIFGALGLFFLLAFGRIRKN